MTHCFSRIGLFIILLALGGVPLAFSAPAPKDPPKTVKQEYAPDELLVKFRVGTSDFEADAVTKKQGADKVRRFKAPRKAADAAIGRWWHVKLNKSQDLKKVMKQLAKQPQVEAVELNYTVHALVTPNDPRYGELWSLNNTGQTGGTIDADIDAPEAWNLGTGSASTLVAVIDSGVDYTHPDLAANMWINPGEIPGNSIDDDGNGYIDDVYGYDFANNDANPFDDNGHGTHVAGTIAAVGNNGVGVVGVNWTARIMAIKFLGANGVGYISGAVSAVAYATDMDARVMNNSWGGGTHSQALEDAISAALTANALFVAAAGNEYTDNDAYVQYPSGYNVDNVLAVAATDHNDTKPAFSNRGAVSVDLGAPGADILSTVPTSGNACCSDPSGYKLLSGTSMAAPHVAGAAALLLAQNPSRTAIGLKDLLMNTTDPIPALAGLVASGGRLNAISALTCTPTQLNLSSLLATLGSTAYLYLTEPVSVRASVMTCGTPVTGAQVSVSFNNGEATLSLHDDGAHGDGAANDGIYGNTWTPSVAGAVTLTFSAAHPSLGSRTTTANGITRLRVSYHYESTPYQWNDIERSFNSSYQLVDDSSVTIPIGFNFNFYGTTYSNVTISSNGFLAFNSAGASSPFNTPIPYQTPPNALIAPWWNDWMPHPAYQEARGAVFSKVEGRAPNRRLTVSWINATMIFHSFPYSGRATFQAILLEGSGEIIFQYQDVIVDGIGIFDYGALTTVGIEDSYGVLGTQYSYFEPKLRDAAAIRFYPGGANERPLANAGGPYQVLENQPLTLSGAGSSDPENDPLTYRWNFGDGTTGTGVSPVHSYSRRGTYTVSLVVNDGQQDSLAATTTVTVAR